MGLIKDSYRNTLKTVFLYEWIGNGSIIGFLYDDFGNSFIIRINWK